MSAPWLALAGTFRSGLGLSRAKPRAFRPFEGMDKAFRKWFDLLDTGAHFPSIGTTDCHGHPGEFIGKYKLYDRGGAQAFSGASAADPDQDRLPAHGKLRGRAYL